MAEIHSLRVFEKLAKIREGDTYCIKSGEIVTHKGSALYRWWMGENRFELLTYLKVVINDSIAGQMVSRDPLIVDVFPKLVRGLRNLEKTYETDSTMVNGLATLILRIQGYLGKLSTGLEDKYAQIEESPPSEHDEEHE